jgi:hypothetical protein
MASTKVIKTKNHRSRGSRVANHSANQTNDVVLRIRNTLTILLEPGQVVELRIPSTRKATVSGYFNDLGKLAKEAATWTGQASGIYTTLNPINPDLMARTANRTVGYAKHTLPTETLSLADGFPLILTQYAQWGSALPTRNMRRPWTVLMSAGTGCVVRAGLTRCWLIQAMGAICSTR